MGGLMTKPDQEDRQTRLKDVDHYCISKRRTSSRSDIWGGLGESSLLVGSHVQPWVNYRAVIISLDREDRLKER